MKGDIYRRKGRKEARGIRGFFGLLWVRGTETEVQEFLKDLGEELDLEERN